MGRWYQDLAYEIQRRTFSGKKVKDLNVHHIHLSEEPAGPFISVANHANYFDPYIAGVGIRRPMNFMANLEGVGFAARLFSEFMGVFNKRKGLPDISAVREALKRVRQGHSIFLFPEGDRSWDGETADLTSGTGGLIKRFGLPVRVIRLTGNYLTFPRWALKTRIGRINIEYDTIDPAVIKELTPAEIEKRIRNFIYNNDIKNQMNHSVEYKTEAAAEGIEHFAFLCPECGAIDTIKGDGHDMVCGKCHFRMTLTGNLIFTKADKKAGYDLKDYAELQKGTVKGQAADLYKNGAPQHQPPLFSDEVKYYRKNEKGDDDFLSCGNLLFYPDRLFFDGEKVSETYLLKDIIFIVDNFNDHLIFGFKQGKQIGRRLFRIEKGFGAYKWILYVNIFKDFLKDFDQKDSVD